MAFKLAGQNPAIEALIYRPSDRSELQTMELRPGMDGFDGPPTLETIGPYNPSEDTSEIIQLAASNSDPRFAAIEEILPLLVGSSGPGGAKNQQYRPPGAPKKWTPPPPDFREKYMPWEQKKAELLESLLAQGIGPKDQQPVPAHMIGAPKITDPVKGVKTEWKWDPHMQTFAPFARTV